MTSGRRPLQYFRTSWTIAGAEIPSNPPRRHFCVMGGQGVDIQSLAMESIFAPQSGHGVSGLSGEKWVGPEEGLGEDVGGPGGPGTIISGKCPAWGGLWRWLVAAPSTDRVTGTVVLGRQRARDPRTARPEALTNRG